MYVCVCAVDSIYIAEARIKDIVVGRFFWCQTDVMSALEQIRFAFTCGSVLLLHTYIRMSILTSTYICVSVCAHNIDSKKWKREQVCEASCCYGKLQHIFLLPYWCLCCCFMLFYVVAGKSKGLKTTSNIKNSMHIFIIQACAVASGCVCLGIGRRNYGSEVVVVKRR